MSPAKQLLLLTKMSLRRRINRISGLFFLRRKKKTQRNRNAVPGKKRTNIVFLLVIGILFSVNSFNIANMFYAKLTNVVKTRSSSENLIRVSRSCYLKLKEMDSKYLILSKKSNDYHKKLLLLDIKELFSYELMAAKQFSEKHMEEYVEVNRHIKEYKASQLLEHYKTYGLAGFSKYRQTLLLPDRSCWKHSESRQLILTAIGWLLLLLCLSLFFMTIGSNNLDLAKVQWSFEWLYTFPASAKILFLSKIAEYTFGTFFGWFIYPAFLFILFLIAGFSWWAAIPVTLFFALFMQFLVSCMRIIAETWLRKSLGRSQLRNMQAFFSIAGIVFFFAVMSIAFTPFGVKVLLDISAYTIPYSVFLPTGFPALFCKSMEYAIFSVSATLILFGLFSWGTTAICKTLIKDGLISGGSMFQDKRNVVATNSENKFGLLRFKGIIGKELRLLIRDRSFFVQLFIVPFFVIGFQLVVNPFLIRAVESNFNRACMLAFGAGAYSLIFSSLNVVTYEGKGLWLLYTFPVSLEKIMIRKAMLWTLFAIIFPALVLGYSISCLSGLNVIDIINIIMVIAGLFIYSVIGAGIGILGTDPFVDEVRKRISPVMVYLFMLLSSLYVYAIYIPDISRKATFLILAALLAFSIWQKVKDYIPLLLDPTQTPTPSISLSDGLIAVLTFTTLQGLFMVMLHHLMEYQIGLSISLSFVFSGILTASLSYLNFWLKRVPNLARQVGLVSDPARRVRLVKVFLEGILWSFPAMIAVLIYFYILKVTGYHNIVFDNFSSLSKTSGSILWAVSIIAIFAAPIVEEYLFRGLVFRGLRKTLSPCLAIVISAAIFAMIHPMVSLIPVFVMGCCAAIAFERNKVLLSPILVHLVYNMFVLIIQI